MDLTSVALLGGGIGLAMGLGGAGGGSLSVAALAWAMGSSLGQAAPVALGAAALAALCGALISWREVRWGPLCSIVCVSAPASACARWAAPWVPQELHAAGFVAVLLAMFLAAGVEPTQESVERQKKKTAVKRWGSLAWIGAVAGAASGLFGVGGGFIIVPGLERWGGASARSVAPTALAAAAMTAGSAWWASSGGASLWAPAQAWAYVLSCALFCALARAACPWLPRRTRVWAFRCAVGSALGLAVAKVALGA